MLDACLYYLLAELVLHEDDDQHNVHIKNIGPYHFIYDGEAINVPLTAICRGNDN